MTKWYYRKENKRAVGRRWEELAAAYLCSLGYEILDRNFYIRGGEVDIVARDGNYLVFIEVKYRSTSAAGDPAEAVDGRKQKRIRLAAREYLMKKGLTEDIPCRFDVVAIVGNNIRLIPNAF